LKWNAAREAPAANLLEKKQTKQQSERKLIELEMSERNKRAKELYNPS
jgi:hypothetical protein